MPSRATDTARPYRGVSAEQRRTDRRARLLEAGLQLLGTVGWEQTSMTAVCAEARLTERYFYESFRNREALLLAVLDGIAEESRRAIVAALREHPEDPEAAVRASIEAFVDLLTVDPRKGRAAMIEAAAAPPLRRRRQELLHEFATLIVAENRQLFGAAALEPPRAEIQAVVFVGGIAELFAVWIAGDLVATREQIVDAAADLFAATAHS